MQRSDPQPVPAQPKGPHFNYDDLEDCQCVLCSRLRVLSAEFVEAQENCAHLPYRSPEESAKRFRVAHRALLACANRRDVYCELSYVTQNRAWGAEFMTWVWARLHNPRWRAEGWWATSSEHKTLGSWVADWDAERRLAGELPNDDKAVATRTARPTGCVV